MFHSPYQTRPGEHYDVHRIVTAVMQRLALDQENLQPEEIGGKSIPHFIYPITNAFGDVSTFAHPILYREKNGQVMLVPSTDGDNPDEIYPIPRCLVDLRAIVNQGRDGSFKVRDRAQLDFEIKRGILCYDWFHKGSQDFLGLGELPLKIFINWVTQAVIRHLAVDPMTQFRISAITGLFYISMHYDSDELRDPRFKARVARRIATAMRTQSTDILDLIENTEPITDIEMFVENVRSLTDSVRMEKFNVLYLYNVVAGTWFGNNARELTAIALEHPPTFISMLDRAVNDRGFKRAGLTTTVQTFTRSNELEEFNRSLSILVKNIVD